MATIPACKGKHWSFDGQLLKIFGVHGLRQGCQTFLGTASSPLVATNFDSPAIKINQDLGYLHISHGGDKVEVIGVNEFYAFQLYFENLLSITTLAQAKEVDGAIITSLFFNGRPRILMIRANPDQALAYFDLNNNPVNFR